MKTKKTKTTTLELDVDDLDIVAGAYELLDSILYGMEEAKANVGTTTDCDGVETEHTFEFIQEMIDFCDDLDQGGTFKIEVEDD